MLRDGKVSMAVDYWQDQGGIEALKYWAKNQVFTVMYLDGKGAWEVSGMATLRPREEAAGVPCLGFALPPGVSQIVSPKPLDRRQKIANPTCSGAAGCSDYMFDTTHAGYVLAVQQRGSERSLIGAFGGKAAVKWSWGPGSPCPSSLSYEERDANGRRVALAEFKLVKTTEDPPPARSFFVNDAGPVTVMKGNVGYGIPGNIPDPFIQWDRQEKAYQAGRKHEAQSNSQIYVVAGSGLLVLAASVIAFWAGRKKWKKG